MTLTWFWKQSLIARLTTSTLMMLIITTITVFNPKKLQRKMFFPD